MPTSSTPNALCLQSTSQAIPSSIHDPPSVEDTTTEGLAYQNDIDQLQQQIASQLEGQDTQTVSEAKAAVQQVVQQYQGTASMSQLIQVGLSKVVCEGAIHQHLTVMWGTVGAVVLALAQQPCCPHGIHHGVPNRISCQAQGQKVLQALVMAHPRTTSLEACPQALDLAAHHGVVAAMLEPLGPAMGWLLLRWRLQALQLAAH